ncbi:hypothetical protein NHX12_034115 [Muraenolepis orangiensis]|uniref:Pyrroline-5-carboxylate reductase dimerisation domain-containing protein n=1 Tax=Muraenolepis orangiensis TaxID=630683 RepID=A0A9Q0E3Y5_9TELE|nr:hypothetical protein NHX12_034115 [Muraenolepis orangiensis]
MDVQLSIGFIGAGNMAYGIAKGILSGKLQQELGIKITHSNSELVSSSAVVFVAVKPHLVTGVLQEISPLGAGRLLRDTGKHPAQLRSEVCTPGGTTIYGLHALEQGGLRAATMSAVESATERARELGQKTAAAGSMK